MSINCQLKSDILSQEKHKYILYILMKFILISIIKKIQIIFSLIKTIILQHEEDIINVIKIVAL